MNWSEAFSNRCSRIRTSASEMLSNATMLANFRFHRPAWTYHEIKAAARDLRETAKQLDKLAEKKKGRETDYAEVA